MFLEMCLSWNDDAVFRPRIDDDVEGALRFWSVQCASRAVFPGTSATGRYDMEGGGRGLPVSDTPRRATVPTWPLVGNDAPALPDSAAVGEFRGEGNPMQM